MLKTALVISFLISGMVSFAGTNDDSLKVDKEFTHIPKRAALFSTFVPGAGQIYNEIGYRRLSNKKHRAWWKVPLIYGGLGACGYYFYHNNKFANLTQQEWEYRNLNNGEGLLDERFTNYSFGALIEGYTDVNDVDHHGYDTYSKRRDLFIFAFIGVWGLNVMEAFVDGHFVTFDVSEDLSLSWHPTLLGNQTPGLSLNLNFN